ncbi:hypothetical protein LTS18_002331, partial [Coniosporium uncinatum]
MPELGEWNEDGALDEERIEESEDEVIPDSAQTDRKRKSWSDREEEESEGEADEDRPAQRRRSNSSEPIPSSPRPERHGLLSTTHRRRTSSEFSRSGSIASRSPSPDSLPRSVDVTRQRQHLLEQKRKYDKVLNKYYTLGSAYSEPISSIVYSLASELGREDNDLLWNAIVGVSSLEVSGRTLSGLGLSALTNAGGSSGWNGDRGERIREILRDE